MNSDSSIQYRSVALNQSEDEQYDPMDDPNAPIVDQNFGCLPWLCSGSNGDVLDQIERGNSLVRTDEALQRDRHPLNELLLQRDDVDNQSLPHSIRESQGSDSSFTSINSLIENIPCLFAIYQAMLSVQQLPYHDDPPLIYDCVLSFFFSTTFIGVLSVSSPQLVDSHGQFNDDRRGWTNEDWALWVLVFIISITHRRLVVDILLKKSDLLDGNPDLSYWKKKTLVNTLALLLQLSEGYKLYYVTTISMLTFGKLNDFTWYFPYFSGLLGAAFWNNDAHERMATFQYMLNNKGKEPILFPWSNYGREELAYKLILPESYELSLINRRYYLWYKTPQVESGVCQFTWISQLYCRLNAVLDEDCLNAQDVLYALSTAVSFIGCVLTMSQFSALVIAVVAHECFNHEAEKYQDKQYFPWDIALFVLVFLYNLACHWVIKSNEIPSLSSPDTLQQVMPVIPFKRTIRHLFDVFFFIASSVVIRSVPILLALDKMTKMSNKEIACNKFPENLSYVLIALIICANATLDLIFPPDTLRQFAHKISDPNHPAILSESRYTLLSLPEKYHCESHSSGSDDKQIYALTRV
ncbi:MAG: hypothetical protein CL816_06895 [Coxiellaceae bacterium]|nr:hypothetical protein [Coxiellaceae bacterium]